MLTRPSTYVVVLSLAAAVGMAAIPYWPAAARALNLSDPASQQNLVITFIGVALALLIASITAILLEQRHELDQLALQVRQNLATPYVRRLRDDEFYSGFLQAARKANSSVCICYFGPRSPDSVPDADRRLYYRKILTLMKRRGDQVRFRRLLRQSPENEIWAAAVAKQLVGKPKVDLALLNDLDSTDPKNAMPLALSVQIIDQVSAWIVAAQSHEQIGDYRDLLIQGGDLPRTFQLYFDRLWKLSDVILEDGILTESGRRLLTKLGK